MKKFLLGLLISSLVIALVLRAHPRPASAADLKQQLYEAAKKEGEVWWQTGIPVDRWNGVVDFFQKKYPGIKVKMLNIRGTTIAGTVITEAGSNKYTMDVILNNIQQIMPLVERDLLVKIPADVWKLHNVNPENIHLDSTFAATYDDGPVWMYNSKLVSTNDIPRNYYDLLKPIFKGQKIVMTASGAHWGYLWPDWKAGHKEKVFDWVKKLRDQEPLIAQSLVGTPRQVASGEVSVGITYASTMLFLPEGSPAKLAPITPSYTTPHGVNVLKGAPHPNAALLLTSWLASPEARPVLALAKQSPAQPRDAGPVAKLLFEGGVQMFRITKQEDVKLLDELGEEAFKAMGWKPN